MIKATLMRNNDGSVKFVLGEARFSDALYSYGGMSPETTYDIYLQGASVSKSNKILYGGVEYNLEIAKDSKFDYRPYIEVDGKCLFFDMEYMETCSIGKSFQVNENNIVCIGDECYKEEHPELTTALKLIAGEYHAWEEVTNTDFGRELNAFGVINQRRASKAEKTIYRPLNQFVTAESGKLNVWVDDKLVYSRHVSDNDYEVVQLLDEHEDRIGLAVVVKKSWRHNISYV